MALKPTQLVAYGLPGLPLAMLGLPLYVYLPTFYAQDLGLSLAVVGTVLLIARALDVITDPLIGLLSDRGLVSGLGRKGFVLLGVPVLLVGVEFLFRPGDQPGALHLLTWTLVAYLGWTVVSVPYNAWGAEVPRSYHERTRLAASREGFMILGTFAAVAVPALMGIADQAATTLERFATLLWVLVPLAVLAAIAHVPAGPKAAAPPQARRDEWQALKANRPARRLMLAYLLNGIANGLPATLFLLFVTHNLKAPEWSGPLLAAYFLSGVLALPLWLFLARRIDKQRSWAASMLLASLAFVTVPFLGPGDVGLFLVICLVSGLSLGADLALPASIQADVAADHHARSGRQRSGVLFGLWGMLTKLALALAVGIAFPVLEFSGFSTERPESAPPVLMLGLLYGGLPVAFKLVAAWLAWNLPRLDSSHESDTKEHAHETPRDSRPVSDPAAS
jgi:Na+/melibiose symporter-like transporter